MCVCGCVFGVWERGVACQLTGNTGDEWAHVSAVREGKEMDRDIKRWALLQATC